MPSPGLFTPKISFLNQPHGLEINELMPVESVWAQIDEMFRSMGLAGTAPSAGWIGIMAILWADQNSQLRASKWIGKGWQRPWGWLSWQVQQLNEMGDCHQWAQPWSPWLLSNMNLTWIYQLNVELIQQVWAHSAKRAEGRVAAMPPKLSKEMCAKDRLALW